MVSELLSILNKFIPDKDAAAKAAVALESEFTKQMSMKSDIIKAEQQNGSGKWRVRLMYMCMTMVSLHFFMYEIIPFIRTIFDLNFFTPQAPDSTELWAFLKIGVGGYLGSRGVEKTMAWYREKK